MPASPCNSARDRRRDVFGARGFTAPLHEGLGKLSSLAREQKRLIRQDRASLLAGRHDERRLIAISGEKIAERVTHANRGMQIDERCVSVRLGKPIGHADGQRLLQGQHIAKVRGELAKHRQLGGAGLPNTVVSPNDLSRSNTASRTVTRSLFPALSAHRPTSHLLPRLTPLLSPTFSAAVSWAPPGLPGIANPGQTHNTSAWLWIPANSVRFSPSSAAAAWASRRRACTSRSPRSAASSDDSKSNWAFHCSSGARPAWSSRRSGRRCCLTRQC